MGVGLSAIVYTYTPCYTPYFRHTASKVRQSYANISTYTATLHSLSVELYLCRCIKSIYSDPAESAYDTGTVISALADVHVL